MKNYIYIIDILSENSCVLREMRNLFFLSIEKWEILIAIATVQLENFNVFCAEFVLFIFYLNVKGFIHFLTFTTNNVLFIF